MTSAQVVETLVTNNSSFQNYTHPDDHTIRTTDTPGFKPFIVLKERVERERLKKLTKKKENKFVKLNLSNDNKFVNS